MMRDDDEDPPNNEDDNDDDDDDDDDEGRAVSASATHVRSDPGPDPESDPDSPCCTRRAQASSATSRAACTWGRIEPPLYCVAGTPSGAGLLLRRATARTWRRLASCRSRSLASAEHCFRSHANLRAGSCPRASAHSKRSRPRVMKTIHDESWAV